MELFAKIASKVCLKLLTILAKMSILDALKDFFLHTSSFFDKILSRYDCDLRKGFSTQQCLEALLEKWKRAIDNGGAFGALLTDLLKAFDTVGHELLIGKLDAYIVSTDLHSNYYITRILGGTFMNSNLRHSKLIYLALINVGYTFS